jgi:alkanesulfonate monooxygenase
MDGPRSTRRARLSVILDRRAARAAAAFVARADRQAALAAAAAAAAGAICAATSSGDRSAPAAPCARRRHWPCFTARHASHARKAGSMSASFFWTLPVVANDRDPEARARSPRAPAGELRDERPGRFTYYDHLAQVARAAQASGFTGAFVPWNENGEDPWIVTAALAREVRRLRFLPEIQPGFATPVTFAKLSATFQRLSGDRLAWKIDLDRGRAARRAHGDAVEGTDWLGRAHEFLEAARGVWSRHPFDYEGRFFAVQEGGLRPPLAGRPLPPVFTSGGSEDALAFAAKHADVHLLDVGADGDLRAPIERLDAAAARVGRAVGRGIRLSVIARHTETEAWHAARLGWSALRLPSGARFDDFRRGDHLWSGFDRLGGTAATGVVGSFASVAGVLDRMARLGVGTFVLEAAPHLEEAYRIGEQLFPRLVAETRPSSQAA